jgi:DNA repair protein SbcD/Mre11
MLSGNHDSAQRLGFCSRLLSAQGLVIAGSLAEARRPVAMRDRFGPVDIHLIPYAEPAHVRELYPEAEARGHNEAMGLMMKNLETDPGRRRVLACHAFVAGGLESDSERPLAVGGSGAVDASRFEGFQYVALGHLHRPQKLAVPGECHYSGSLFKYSFSECSHQKGINLVEMDADGACRVERIPLSAKRDLRRIEGSLEELLRPPDGAGRQDYLEAVLTDEGPLLQPMERLRKIYPNMLHIERPYLARNASGGRISVGDHRAKTAADLFGTFFRQVSGRGMSAAEAEAFGRVLAPDGESAISPSAGYGPAPENPSNPGIAPEAAPADTREKAASGDPA